MNPNYLRAAIAAFALAHPLQVFAQQFIAESIESWSGCHADCADQTKLKYTDDQVKQFSSAMYKAGWGRAAWWRNQDVYGTDLKEDLLNGQDDLYVDPYTLYIYSGHGSADDVSDKQRFQAPMCHSSTGYEDACIAQSQTIFLGERSGPYSNSSKGNIRYLILATCYSVHTQPNQQWGDMFRWGGDMIFGYRNTSADSSYTDEVPADFAWAAYDDDDRFKGAWFWAIEDWWVDDTGALVTAGKNKDHAHSRRDYMTRWWGVRLHNELHTWRTWTWHEG